MDNTTLARVRTITIQANVPEPEKQAADAARYRREAEAQQARLASLANAAESEVLANASKGKSYAEVTVQNDEEYEHLAAIWKEKGFAVSPNGDGYNDRVIVIKWGK